MMPKTAVARYGPAGDGPFDPAAVRVCRGTGNPETFRHHNRELNPSDPSWFLYFNAAAVQRPAP